MPLVFSSTIVALHKRIEEQVEAASKPIHLHNAESHLPWWAIVLVTREYKKNQDATGRNGQRDSLAPKSPAGLRLASWVC